MDVLKTLKEAKEKSRKRNFVQSWDLSVNLKGIDLKKPENRLNFDFQLPEGSGRDVKVCVIADTLVPEAEKIADFLIKKQDIAGIAANKKKMKEIVNNYDFFFGEISLMADIGRYFGPVMGPRGKMARPIPPKVKIEPLIQASKKTVRIILKENPVIHIFVGKENMEDEKISKNIEAVINFLQEKLPKGKDNLKSVYIKLTMGKAIRIAL
jgi:large subunit ribosomal protein L1